MFRFLNWRDPLNAFTGGTFMNPNFHIRIRPTYSNSVNARCIRWQLHCTAVCRYGDRLRSPVSPSQYHHPPPHRSRSLGHTCLYTHPPPAPATSPLLHPTPVHPSSPPPVPRPCKALLLMVGRQAEQVGLGVNHAKFPGSRNRCGWFGGMMGMGRGVSKVYIGMFITLYRDIQGHTI